MGKWWGHYDLAKKYGDLVGFIAEVWYHLVKFNHNFWKLNSSVYIATCNVWTFNDGWSHSTQFHWFGRPNLFNTISTHETYSDEICLFWWIRKDKSRKIFSFCQWYVMGNRVIVECLPQSLVFGQAIVRTLAAAGSSPQISLLIMTLYSIPGITISPSCLKNMKTWAIDTICDSANPK